VTVRTGASPARLLDHHGEVFNGGMVEQRADRELDAECFADRARTCIAPSD
jgi:hypothetical protein